MKIILYIVLIAIVAAVGYGLYVRISDTDITSITDGISSVFNGAVDWLSGKLSEVIS